MRLLIGISAALIANTPLSGAAVAQQGDTLAATSFAAGTIHHHESAVLGERRTFYVYLPPSYADTSFGPRRYPVIYVLDAPVVWQFVVGTHRLLVDWDYQWPQAIVVGVRSPNRNSDFTPTHDSVTSDGAVVPGLRVSGGGPEFLRYLAEELIPTVDRQFRTTSNRTLVGHSLGGLFALYAVSARPALFRNYLVLDPGTDWAKGLVQRTVPATLRSGVRAPLSLFLGRAGIPRGEPWGARARINTAGQVALATELAALRVDGVRVQVREYPGEEHAPMVVPATNEALRFFFGGPIIPEGFLADVPGIEERTRRLGRELGIDTVPDPHEISLSAEDLFGVPSHRAAALELFRLNVRSFPNRARPYRELGLALLVTGDTAAARTNLREALRLAPADTAVARRLRELGAK